MSAELYDRDAVEWAEQNAALLRAGRFDEADIEHIAEEIEDMARSRRRELRSYLRVLLTHLLKYKHQPERRGASWKATLVRMRTEIPEVLEENPSLRPKLASLAEQAYPAAVRPAAAETGLPEAAFPGQCPYTLDQILDLDYLPE